MSIEPKPDIKSRCAQIREKGERILQWFHEPKDRAELADNVERLYKKRGEIKLRY